ncbi:MAG: hypothetical protein EOP45_16375, partial [Sphingobacteriaceae bacterium]
MSRTSKATPINSTRKGSKPADKADDSLTTTPSDAKQYPEHLPAAEPDLSFPIKGLDEWDEPPVDWEMEGPTSEREIVLNRENVHTPDATIGLSPTTLGLDKNLITLRDSFAIQALNGLLSGMLSVPNSALDTAEIPRSPPR